MKKATNNNSMRQANRRLILDMIRRQPISRADIAEHVELTRASVTIITEELIASGLIYEAEAIKSGKGRNPVLLMLNPDGVRFGGVNIKREHIEVGVVNLAGGSLMQRVLPYDGSSPDAMLGRVCEAFAPYADRLESVGVCAPGPLDYRAGTILNPPNFRAWHDVPVAQLIASGLSGRSVRLENVSNALALEEHFFGVNRDVPNFAVLLVDSGIGMGVVLNDRLLRGAKGLGSELGHTTVEMDGVLCDCGNVGCLERYASMPALLGGSAFASWRDMMDHLDTSLAAQALLEREAKYLAVALVNVINMLDIELVILRGEIAYNARPLCTLLNQRIGGRIVTRRDRLDTLVCGSEAPCSARTAAMPAINAFFHV